MNNDHKQEQQNRQPQERQQDGLARQEQARNRPRNRPEVEDEETNRENER